LGRFAGLAAFFAPLAVYGLTAARAITITDSGELAAAAVTLGIAHPPGYPLFVLLGRLASLVPISTPACRLALVSAVATALTSLMIWALAHALLRRMPGVDRVRGAASLGALAGALHYAFARTPWSQAVVVEVYALHAAFVTLFLARAFLALETGAGAAWLGLGLAFGFALAHHLTGILIAPALILTWIAARQTQGQGGRRLLAILGAAVVPLTSYLYLPLRSRLSPPVNWDYPETWQRFFVHVTARQYHGMFGSRGLRGEELRRFLGVQLPGEATLLFVALALVGLVVLFRARRPYALVTVTVLAAFVIYNLGYPIHDIAVYYLPPLAVMAIWAAVGAGWLVGWVARARPAMAWPVAATLVLAAGLSLTAHWAQNDQRRFTLIERYVHDVFRAVQPGGVLFTGQWDTVASPALYEQHVAGFRPDVKVFDLGRLSSPTLARDLERQAPDLARDCAEEVALVAEAVGRAERGAAYDPVVLGERYRRLHRRLAEAAVARYPTYFTSDLLRTPLFSGIDRIPEGLVFRATGGDSAPGASPELAGPGITVARARDQNERNMIEEYGRMLRHRAAYLERIGQAEAARALLAGGRARGLLPPAAEAP
jgi:hypothetical protein